VLRPHKEKNTGLKTRHYGAGPAGRSGTLKANEQLRVRWRVQN